MTCPGYPTIPDIIFLDQTAEVARRSAHTSTSSDKSSPSTVTISTVSDVSTDLQLVPKQVEFVDSSLPQCISLDKDELFTTFFLATHVANPDVAARFSVNDASYPLSASIKAMGGALLALNYWDGDLMQTARVQYGKALRITNAALAHPKLALDDTTLLSVLILTAFETVAGEPERTLTGWFSHIHGATLLLQLRGIKQVHHREGRMLYLQACAGILVACLRNILPVPTALHRLHAEMAKYVTNPDDPAWRLHCCSMDFVDFRHQIYTFKLTDPNAILAKAAQMEQALRTCFDGAPYVWNYRVHGDDGVTNDGLPRYYYIYYSRTVAYIWSCVRAHQHMLHGVIQYVLNHPCVEDQYKTKFASSKDDCVTIRNELIAAIPQELGLRCSPAELDILLDRPWTNRPPSLTNVWNQQGDDVYFFDEADNGRLPVMHTLGGFGLLWPLLSLGKSKDTTPRLKTLVRKLFRFLGEHHRIMQAHALADLLSGSD